MSVVPTRLTRMFARQTAADASTQVPVADIFEALSHEYRWRTVEYVAATSEGVTLDYLVTQFAARELEAWPDTNEDELASRIAISLCHFHLGKLDDVGAIDWQPDDDFIAKTDDTAAFARVADAAFTRSTDGGTR